MGLFKLASVFWINFNHILTKIVIAIFMIISVLSGILFF